MWLRYKYIWWGNCAIVFDTCFVQVGPTWVWRQICSNQVSKHQLNQACDIVNQFPGLVLKQVTNQKIKIDSQIRKVYT